MRERQGGCLPIDSPALSLFLVRVHEEGVQGKGLTLIHLYSEEGECCRET